MVLFALSCVGLLLFLWLSFGGEIPFNPQGYRFEVAFPDSQELATQADVRIAGVSVGKVIAKTLDPEGNRTLATIQLNNQYAPIHKNATAILREKTILGETYVQITPGTRSSPPLPDGATLPRGRFNKPCSWTPSSMRSIPPPGATSRSGSSRRPRDSRATTRTSTTCSATCLRSRPTPPTSSKCWMSSAEAVVNLVRNGGTVFAALARIRPHCAT